MKVSVEKPGSPSEVLEHHGKKGMKWGVRNRYAARSASTAARNRKVGAGGGTRKQKLATNLTSSPLRLIQAKGSFKKAATNRAKSEAAHVARLKAGKATTLDQLRRIGTVRITDAVRRS